MPSSLASLERAPPPAMYLLYSALTAAGMVLLLPYFLLRGARRGKYLAGLRQRLGYLPEELHQDGRDSSGCIWVHAVSVGEVLAALPLARRLKERSGGRKLLLSTTTATGQRLARERADFANGFFYFPLDWAGPVRRVLRAVKPALVVILETEIWPNFLREARRAGVPVVFVNGRISERSYARYRWADGFLGGFLARVLSNAALFLMQSDEDSRRLRALGAPEGRVEVAGNLKYDLPAPVLSPALKWLEEEIRRQERWPVVVAGSVVEDEEEAVLAAFDVVQRRWRRALLVLVPRRPERFEAAARIAADGGWSVVRRSRLSLDAPLDDSADLLLLDSMGELAGFYSLADATFVGGSLVPAGGHNILEPAWFSQPPVFGPSMDNFREMAAQFLKVGAGIQVASSVELGRVWIELIEDRERREGMGRAARALIERNRGATERVLKRLGTVLDASERLHRDGTERSRA